MPEDLRQKLTDARPLILWAELGGLLHDIGKLSNAFYDYRRNWRKMPDGWKKDPHDHKFLKDDQHYHIVKGLFQEAPPAVAGGYFEASKTCSIETLVHDHIDPKDVLAKLLKAADGKDAALDRNNPLFTADQAGTTIFDTDVFGAEYEERRFDPRRTRGNKTVDDKRRELYSKLSDLVPEDFKDYDHTKREKVLEAISAKFSDVFSDTTRPDNDTSLWEHCYAVASLFKTLVAHKVIYGEALDSSDKVSFSILGVGWDGLGFLSQGEKIGDITGRIPILQQLKERIKELIEYDYALGNTVYEDNDGIYFLVPRTPREPVPQAKLSGSENAYAQLLQEMESVIKAFAINLTGGDLQPQLLVIPDTKFMTQVTTCIERLNDETVFPFSIVDDATRNVLSKAWLNTKETVCPVCLRRPVKSETLGICETCDSRRIRFYGKDRHIQELAQMEKDELKNGTHFISEITAADKDGKRAALIVAKFDLRQWLNGRMERSLFVTEARGLENELADLGNTRSFENDEREAKVWLEHSPFGNLVRDGYDFRRLETEIQRIENFGNLVEHSEREYAQKTAFLYDRRIRGTDLNRDPEEAHGKWEAWLKNTHEEYGHKVDNPASLLANILCAKTPTPSTVLDAWQTTEEFFKKLATKETANERILGTKPQFRFRAEMEVARDLPADLHEGAANDGSVRRGDTVLQEDIQIIWLKENGQDKALIVGAEFLADTADTWKDAELWLVGKSFKRDNFRLGTIRSSPGQYGYHPMRIITTSPDMFLAIVPADKAIEITQQIYKEYIKQFGKVMGRLPLSVGNIFFEEHTPMFVVLDSARRMVRNFEKLGEQPVEMRVSKDHFSTTEGTNGDRIVIKLDQVRWPGCPPMERSFEWRLPYKLGGGEIDYYHPYFIVKKEDENSSHYSYSKNYFRTVVGDVIHFTEVQPGDILRVYPNYYDFEFLDATTRRYDLALRNGRRKSNVTGFFSKPYLLDDLEQGLVGVWKEIGKQGNTAGVSALPPLLWEYVEKEAKSGGAERWMTSSLMPNLTDTQLRNIESLWLVSSGNGK